jgi:hypothetical protein
MGTRTYDPNVESDVCEYIRHNGQLRCANDEYEAYNIGGKEVHLPKKYIKDHDETYVVIPRWVAKQKKLKGEWR